MTLTSAINAARELLDCVDGNYKEVADNLREQLAALPDNPKSEDEIVKIIRDELFDNSGTVYDVVQKLKEANVLYVQEGK